MTNTHLLIMVLVAGACTFATRLFPFALFGGKKQVPKFVQYLGNVLPVAILGILIVYCLKDFDYTSRDVWPSRCDKPSARSSKSRPQ